MSQETAPRLHSATEPEEEFENPDYVGEELLPEDFSSASGENERDKSDRALSWHLLSDPAKPLTPRHWEFCRLLAKGLPHFKVHEILGYSRTYISVLSSHPKVRAKIAEMQDKTFEIGINDRIKETNHAAFDVLERIVRAENQPDIKPALQADVAKWIIEKSTGKAKQEIENKGGGLSDFMTLLRQASEAQKLRPTALPETEGQGEFIDVTPATKGEKDSLESWVDSNL